MFFKARKIFTPAFQNVRPIYASNENWGKTITLRGGCLAPYMYAIAYRTLYVFGSQKNIYPCFLEYHPIWNIYSCNEKGNTTLSMPVMKKSDINNSARRLSSPIQDSSCSAFVRLNQQYNKGLQSNIHNPMLQLSIQYLYYADRFTWRFRSQCTFIKPIHWTLT